MKFSRYIIAIITIILLLCSVLIFLNNNNRQQLDAATPTGFSDGVTDQPQFMYDGVIYYYYATGFHERLPEDYYNIGSIESVSNYEKPSEDFVGAQLEEGQKIYKSGNSNILYVQYDSGYAKFFTENDFSEFIMESK